MRCGPKLIRYILLRLGRPAYVKELKREYQRYGCRVNDVTISVYLYMLKKLGLVELVRVEDSGRLIPRHYYWLVPEKVNDPCWEHPIKCYGATTKKV